VLVNGTRLKRAQVRLGEMMQAIGGHAGKWFQVKESSRMLKIGLSV